MGSVEVRLDWDEMMRGCTAGSMRVVRHLMKNDLDHKWGMSTALAFDNNCYGCLAELVVAKHLGVWWSGEGLYEFSDVGQVEVRYAHKRNFRLILHDDDLDDRPYVLVTGEGAGGSFWIDGWIMGRDGKHDEWWEDPGTSRPAYFVPRDQLRPIEDLHGVYKRK